MKLRENPDANSPARFVLLFNSPVCAVKSQGDWSLVALATLKEETKPFGWLKREFLAEKEMDPLEALNKAKKAETTGDTKTAVLWAERAGEASEADEVLQYLIHLYSKNNEHEKVKRIEAQLHAHQSEFQNQWLWMTYSTAADSKSNHTVFGTQILDPAWVSKLQSACRQRKKFWLVGEKDPFICQKYDDTGVNAEVKLVASPAKAVAAGLISFRKVDEKHWNERPPKPDELKVAKKISKDAGVKVIDVGNASKLQLMIVGPVRDAAQDAEAEAAASDYGPGQNSLFYKTATKEWTEIGNVEGDDVKFYYDLDGDGIPEVDNSFGKGVSFTKIFDAKTGPQITNLFSMD